MTTLHEDSLVIDGLIVANWTRAVFEDMRRAGLSAANCTVSVWEGFQDTVNNIARMKVQIRDNSDLLTLVRTTHDITLARQTGKTGIVLGFQNAQAFEDNLGYIDAFWDMGVRVVQLTYNTQNLLGTGCYERDGGLSGFGHEAVAEMNRVGMLIDLSHVGAVTAREAITASRQPVCYSHCLPSGLKAHPRNKSDEDLRFIAEHGGFIGITMFPPFMGAGANATVDDYVAAIDYVIGLAGEDNVGIGTDFTQGHDAAFFDWITLDKGRHRRLTNHSAETTITSPAGLSTIGELPNLTIAMERAGWRESRVRKVLGQNWMDLFARVWRS
ncbi:MAG: dipeptidase [Paralcaligenes sp.]